MARIRRIYISRIRQFVARIQRHIARIQPQMARIHRFTADINILTAHNEHLSRAHKITYHAHTAIYGAYTTLFARIRVVRIHICMAPKQVLITRKRNIYCAQATRTGRLKEPKKARIQLCITRIQRLIARRTNHRGYSKTSNAFNMYQATSHLQFSSYRTAYSSTCHLSRSHHHTSFQCAHTRIVCIQILATRIQRLIIARMQSHIARIQILITCIQILITCIRIKTLNALNTHPAAPATAPCFVWTIQCISRLIPSPAHTFRPQSL